MNVFRTGLVCLLVSGPAASNCVFASQPPRYTITDLGTLGTGSRAEPRAINELSQVVGWSYTQSFMGQEPFLWDDGDMISLGLLPNGFHGAQADGINDGTDIVGRGVTQNIVTHAFLWKDGLMQDLGTLGGNTSVAYAINDHGWVVGDAQFDGTPSRHAFLWRVGIGMQSLGTLGGNRSTAYAVNSLGQIVGWSTDASSAILPFIWENGVMSALPTLVGGSGQARGINDKGEVAGYSNAGAFGVTHAVYWEADGTIHDLGKLPSTSAAVVHDMNNHRQIVGYCLSAGIPIAFLWQDGQMHNLNHLVPPWGGILLQPRGINDKGEIAVEGRSPSGAVRAYLLTPVVCTGDLTGDWAVGSKDLAALLMGWGPCPEGAPCPADLNGDGVVNGADLATLLVNWGPCE